MRRPSNERRLTGPFATGFRMTISSMPETATPAMVLADVLLAPLLAALLYLLISRDGQGHGATLPAVVGAASMQTVLLSGSALLRDRLEGTLAHLSRSPCCAAWSRRCRCCRSRCDGSPTPCPRHG